MKIRNLTGALTAFLCGAPLTPHRLPRLPRLLLLSRHFFSPISYSESRLFKNNPSPSWIDNEFLTRGITTLRLKARRPKNHRIHFGILDTFEFILLVSECVSSLPNIFLHNFTLLERGGSEVLLRIFTGPVHHSNPFPVSTHLCLPLSLFIIFQFP